LTIVRKKFSASFTPQPVENHSYKQYHSNFSSEPIIVLIDIKPSSSDNNSQLVCSLTWR